jgi:hypothetical protein
MKTIITSILTFLGLGQTSEKNNAKLNSNSKQKMDINNGFQIENPNIFVPWKIDEKTFTDLFN